MSEAETTATPTATKKPNDTSKAAALKAKLSRKTKKKLGRDKRKAKILGDKEYAAKLFDGRSKRSDEKKVKFKKRRAKK